LGRRLADSVRELGWASLPLAIGGVSLIVAVFGFYWDVATHIDHGRDDGVFGNAAHWPILVGLTGIWRSPGLVSMLLGHRRRAVRRRGGPATAGSVSPIGGALLFLCGSSRSIGFPIDDVWHRIFGQDVTLWSPPHIQMVAGRVPVHGRAVGPVRRGRAGPARPAPARRRYVTEVALAGAVLIGMSTLQGEFDFGVPQFRLLFQPLLIAVAAGIALVPARIRLGRGGALLAVAFFLGLRGLITLVVSGAFEHLTFHLPLYLGAAVAVELVARWVPPTQQLTFGALGGLGIGTFGLAVEAAWSHVWMPIAWTARCCRRPPCSSCPPRSPPGSSAASSAVPSRGPGCLGSRTPAGLAMAAALVLVVASPTRWRPGADAEARMQLSAVDGPTDGDHVEATIEIDPPEVADEPEWLHVIAWQGAGWWSEEATLLDDLEPIGEGRYRTVAPVPVHGEWKAMVRLHDGRVMAAAHLPPRGPGHPRGGGPHPGRGDPPARAAPGAGVDRPRGAPRHARHRDRLGRRVRLGDPTAPPRRAASRAGHPPRRRPGGGPPLTPAAGARYGRRPCSRSSASRLSASISAW
jgi:hypothetical protein